MARDWELVERKVEYKDSRLAVFVDTIENEAGETSNYTLVDFSDAVFIIAERRSDSKIALVRQHRYPLGAWQTEIIAGGLPPNTDPIEQARSELLQEGNLLASEIRQIGSFAMQPNRAVNYGYVIHAIVDETDQAGVANQEGDESIENIAFYDQAEVRAMVAGGGITGAYCLASLAIYWQLSSAVNVPNPPLYM